jgi:2-methylcitrate dehydratase PrpD
MGAIRSETSDPLSFILGLRGDQVPARVSDRLDWLLADLAAVSLAGRPAPASGMAAEFAAGVYPGDQASSLIDSRRLGVAGAAFTGGVLANVLDFDDGHRLTKGHPGAMVIPAALAVAQAVDASVEEFREAVTVGYEIAIRAGIAQHARDPAYHASGSWGSLGVAALAARLLGLGRDQTAAAIGLAEYHGPLSPIMRCCAEPAMTKDACSWGALVGVQSALLAARGFTSLSAEFLAEPFDDLGERWRLEELYIKGFPCCRWSQGAIATAQRVHGRPGFAPERVERIVVRTFEAACGLAQIVPGNTEEAQYNLAWPVACALAHRTFSVQDALGPFDDPLVRALFERVTIEADPELTAAFPARRLTGIEVVMAGGERLAEAPREAAGEPEDPDWSELVAAKVRAHVDPLRDYVVPTPGARLGAMRAEELFGVLLSRIEVPVA